MHTCTALYLQGSSAAGHARLKAAASLGAQACAAAGGPDMLTGEVLPQLLPLFSCAPAQRPAYGCSIPSARPGAQPDPAPNLAAPSVQALQRRTRDTLALAMATPAGSAGNLVVLPASLLQVHASQGRPPAHFVTSMRTQLNA